MTKMKTFIYHPSTYFGGASVLFYRLFTANNYKEFYFIDCINGFTQKKVGDHCKLILNTDKEKLSNEINDNDIIICISTQISGLLNDLSNLNVNPKILIWIVHPYEASLIFFPFAKRITSKLGYDLGRAYIKTYYKKYKTLQNFIMNNSGKSLFYMDTACIRATDYFLNLNLASHKNNESYLLPIPFIPYEKEIKTNFFFNGELNLGYFGRIEDFKSPPLRSLLNDILNSKLKIKTHIIGNGRDLKKIKDEFSKKLDIIFLGEMDNLDARKYIYDNIDIIFCMGTAALDTASMGVPTVLLNPSNKVINQKYNWLYHTDGFTLGDYTDSPWFEEDGNSFTNIIEHINTNIMLVSKRNHEYVFYYHSIDSVINKVMSNITKSNIKLNDLKALF
ncbi:glycosyltransferase family 4 protein [Providencia sp. M-8]|uniref:glycosyltransferase family 4 protein n=1 Tax=Providencia sp. M-8 TaxID=2713151 RepID=UPI001409B111